MTDQATTPHPAHTHELRQVAVDFEDSRSVTTYECTGCDHTEARAQ